MRKLKVRNIVSQMLKIPEQAEFLGKARKTAASVVFKGQTYRADELAANAEAATVVFERLIELEINNQLEDRLRPFAHWLDLWLYADRHS
jgi:hypothetical protein